MKKQNRVTISKDDWFYGMIGTSIAVLIIHLFIYAM